MKRIGGNQLGGVYLWVTGSDRFACLILIPLNALSSMNSVGLKVLTIIFYILLKIIVVISAFAAYIFVEMASQIQWVIKPVTILQETEPSNSAELNKEVFNLKKKLIQLFFSNQKTWADMPRDSFEIPYINDYPTYIWAYDLSSHPELLMATYPLKPNIQLNKSVVKPYKTVSNLDQSLMYLQDESLAQSMDVLKFIDSLYASFLHKEEFIHSVELHIGYAFFLQDFRPAMLLKLLAQLQKAYEYFPGWISR
ncbi:MAG: hypothetical protein EZS28_016711 [Streblomastix strix]|uniref:Uncharacterized protein n=1 Tax=Streblomastix strix TaxID=222440 RepID=A0A5J4VYU4_9EUKA|nr:MAG: hypothetical protein EZS28_016711 [Streblomastix strix]